MYINLTDLTLVLVPTFLYSLFVCWFFSKIIPKGLIIYSATVGMIIPTLWMYFEPGRYWLEVTVGLVGLLAGSLLAYWLLPRRLRKQMRPVYARPCDCPGLPCVEGSWGGCGRRGSYTDAPCQKTEW